MRVYLRRMLTISVIGWLGVLPIGLLAARAQSTSPTHQNPAFRTMRFRPPADLTDRGLPGNRRGTGAITRSGGSGFELAEELVALSPESNIGLTVEEYPSFWFYVPFTESEFDSMQFALIDSSGEELYLIQVDAPDDLPGIIHFNLPRDGTPLVTNNEYRWFLSIFLENPAEDLHQDARRLDLSGWIWRDLPGRDLEAELALASSNRERAAIFAERGIWYTALSELANLYRSETEISLLEDWEGLLGSVGLANLASEPILNCCQSSQN